MGVSKQDWKNYQTNDWAGGQCKPTLDQLTQEIDALCTAIDAGDQVTFLAYTADDGHLMQAAQTAWQASSAALDAIKLLTLAGNQRRFANKYAIATCDSAIAAVVQYENELSVLMADLVRGVRLEHDAVQNGDMNMAAVKSGDLADRVRTAEAYVKGAYDEADGKVALLAAIDKIGVV